MWDGDRIFVNTINIHKNMKKYFLLFVLSLLVSLPQAARASTPSSEASVSLVPTLTNLKVDEISQVLFNFTIKNDNPQEIDIRSLSFVNTGTLALEPVLSDIEVFNDQGVKVSTRVRFFEDWDLNKDEMISSFVQIQLDSQKIPSTHIEAYTIRAVVQGGVHDEFLSLKTDSVSVLVPGTTFVRDLTLDISDVDQKLVTMVEEGTVYAPNKVSQKESALLPDLVIEQMYFAKEYGYQKDVIVVPVCNEGNGPTPLDSRIEGTAYPSDDYLRDFIIRKQLVSGKCFEQVFSIKRDLRINKAGSHNLRVQLDLQNLIREERENNNERQDLVQIKDETVTTNNEFITDQPLSLRQRILARLGLRRERPKVAAINENTSDDRRSSSRMFVNPSPKSEIIDNENYIVHPNYGTESRYLGTRLLLEDSAPAENNIIRKELPTSAEEIWAETKWERDSTGRLVRLNRKVEELQDPTQTPENELTPTFREPAATVKYRTSYRGLRSGVRTETDYRGQRTNNAPWGTQEGDLDAFCEDTDGLNVYEKGTVTYKSRRMPKARTQSDVTRGQYILEFYCDGGYMRRELVKCEEGMVADGYCKSGDVE